MGRVRRLVRRNDLAAALVRCRDDAVSEPTACSQHDVVRLGRAVRRTLAVLPGDGSAAHAWVEVDGRPALPAANGKFARLFVL